MNWGGIMKVSSFRIFNKSKKAMSSKEFGIDFFVNESDLFAIFCVVKTGVEIGRDKTVPLLAKINMSKNTGVSKIEYIDDKNISLAIKNKIMDMIAAYIKKEILKK